MKKIGYAVLFLFLAACAAEPTSSGASMTTTPKIADAPASKAEVPHNSQPFDEWRADLRKEALAKGISAKTFDAAFKGVAPIERIIELDRNQPEFKRTLAQYQASAVSDKRVADGRVRYKQHEKLLSRISKETGVPAEVIVALWGMETNFGGNTGSFNIVNALATLAYDGRRSVYFRGELVNALTMLERGDVALKDFRGSWAGAFGQCQFMPSTYLKHAADGSGDGKKDIWKSLPDVFASAANYLKNSGWKKNQVIAIAVTNPQKTIPVRGAPLVPVTDWTAQGIEALPGEAPLSALGGKVRLVVPEADNPEQAYLVGENYEALLSWNRSNLFALSVAKLAERIAP